MSRRVGSLLDRGSLGQEVAIGMSISGQIGFETTPGSALRSQSSTAGLWLTPVGRASCSFRTMT